MKRLIAIAIALLPLTASAAPVTSSELMGLGMPAQLAGKVSSIGNGTTSTQWGIGGTTELTLTDDKLTFSGSTASIQTGGILQMLNSTAGVMWQFQDDGDLVGNSTNQGNVILDAQDKGLYILSGAGPAIDADVTGASAATNTTAYFMSNSSTQNMAWVSNIADSGGTNLNFLKTRAAANASNANTIVASGDDIAAVVAYGADGAVYQPAASILLEVDGTPGSADMPGRIVFSVTPDGAASVAEAMRISQNKNVSIQAQFTSAATSDIGWSIVNAANQACNTTCTSACVFGFNTGALGNLLACTDATADSCVCAGSS